MYCTRSDIETVFGVANINKWGDADNTRNRVAIEARIVWAIADAQDQINSRLAVKFTVPLSPVPLRLQNLCAKLAGVVLYKLPRGLVDVETSLADVEEEIETTLSKILNDQIKLVGVVPTATSLPDVDVQINKTTTENTNYQKQLLLTRIKGDT